MNNYLLYLAYGGDDYNNEALYSLLSYYKFNTQAQNRVVIYTDNTGFFKQYLPEDVIYRELAPEELTEWKGTVNFNHRIKIKVLQDACTRFKGNILYTDTDTFYTRDITPLFDKIDKGAILFHKHENTLRNNRGGIAGKMRRFLKKHNTFALKSQPEHVILTENLAIWNAGSIGFKTDFCDVLQPVLELTDELYSRYRLFVMEQIAFNYFFQKISMPESTEDYVGHYWYFKEFRTVLKHFFLHHKGKPASMLIADIHKIDPFYLSSEKRAYKVMSFWQKQWQKLSKGRKWKIMEYEL